MFILTQYIQAKLNCIIKCVLVSEGVDLKETVYLGFTWAVSNFEG